MYLCSDCKHEGKLGVCIFVDCLVSKMVWMSPKFHVDARVLVLTMLSCLCATSDGTGAGYGGAV